MLKTVNEFNEGDIAIPYMELYDPDMWELVQSLHVKLLNRVGIYNVSYGRGRVTFVCDRFVVKLPRNDFGMRCNVREHKLGGKRWSCGTAYARTKLSRFGDLPIILMERVDPYIDNTDVLPGWTYTVDCFQVGINRQGTLVAYDFG